MLVRTDSAHDKALGVFQQANAERWELVTTNTVVVETYALLLNRTRGGRAHAIEFLDHLERTRLRVERVSEDDEQNAIALVRRHTDKAYSLCDAQSFVVMEGLQMTGAIAADADFRQYGLRILL